MRFRVRVGIPVRASADPYLSFSASSANPPEGVRARDERGRYLSVFGPSRQRGWRATLISIATRGRNVDRLRFGGGGGWIDARMRPPHPLRPTLHDVRGPIIGSCTEYDIHNCGTHNCIWFVFSPCSFVFVHFGFAPDASRYPHDGPRDPQEGAQQGPNTVT